MNGSEPIDQVPTSLYLVRRAEALLGTLHFFAAPRGDHVTRRLQFLAQIDFWEWEIDNLIYSFTNLDDRARTWESARHAEAKLHKFGVVVDAKIIRRVQWRGRRGWRLDQRPSRVAPADLLAETIDAWNALVDLSEAQFVRPMLEKADRFNIRTRRDLQALKKTLPGLAPAPEEPA